MPVLTPLPTGPPMPSRSLRAQPRDDSLIRRAQRGDLAAFAELTDTYGPLAYRVALRLLGTRQDAADVTREALVAAWPRLPGFQRGTSYPAWLLQLVIQRALSRVTGSGAGADPAAAVIAMLPPLQRTAIVLHDFEGLSHDEVARITASTAPAVRADLLRGRRRLALALVDQG
jgi:RNA polymerase sigma-70 factor, ECF subfamily